MKILNHPNKIDKWINQTQAINNSQYENTLSATPLINLEEYIKNHPKKITTLSANVAENTKVSGS